jgi:hypothetical protein
MQYRKPRQKYQNYLLRLRLFKLLCCSARVQLQNEEVLEEKCVTGFLLSLRSNTVKVGNFDLGR